MNNWKVGKVVYQRKKKQDIVMGGVKLANFECLTIQIALRKEGIRKHKKCAIEESKAWQGPSGETRRLRTEEVLELENWMAEKEYAWHAGRSKQK